MTAMAKITPPSTSSPPSQMAKTESRSVLKSFEVMDYVKQSRSHDAGDERVKCCVGNHLRVGCDIAAEASYQKNRREKADNHHQAVAFYGQVRKRYLKKYGMHSVQRLAYSFSNRYFYTLLFNFVIFVENDDFRLNVFGFFGCIKAESENDYGILGIY